MRFLITLFVIVGFATAGCDDIEPLPEVPDDVAYSIIETDTIPGVRQILRVRIDRRVPESTLRAIALQLKSKQRQEFRSTFITYLLKGEVLGTTGWATTHFMPDLRVRILGLSADEVAMLVAAPAPPSDEIIGMWLVGAFRIAIYRKDEKLFMQRMLGDGGFLTDEMVERRDGQWRRFDFADSSDDDVHYVIVSNERLQLWHDNEHLVSVSWKIYGRDD